MDEHTLERAACVLRCAAGGAVPARTLHQLADPDADAPLSYRTFLRRLREQPHRFLLLERRTPFPGDADWPDDVRQAYGAALAEAGLQPELRVTLAHPVEQEEALPLLVPASGLGSERAPAARVDPVAEAMRRAHESLLALRACAVREKDDVSGLDRALCELTAVWPP